MKVARVLRGALAGKNMLVEGPGVAETLGMELPEPSQKERGYGGTGPGSWHWDTGRMIALGPESAWAT